MAVSWFEPSATGYRECSIHLFSSKHALGVMVARVPPNHLARVRVLQGMPGSKIFERRKDVQFI